MPARCSAPDGGLYRFCSVTYQDCRGQSGGQFVPGMASIAGRSSAAEAGPLLALVSAQFPVTMTALAPRFWYSYLRNVLGLEACLASRWRGIVLGSVR